MLFYDAVQDFEEFGVFFEGFRGWRGGCRGADCEEGDGWGFWEVGEEVGAWLGFELFVDVLWEMGVRWVLMLGIAAGSFTMCLLVGSVDIARL